MGPRRYVFASRWRVAAPLAETWTFLTSPGQRWVDWWPGLETADVRRTAELVGSTALCTWRSPAAYRLTFALTLTDVEPSRLVVLAADGDLTGTSSVLFEAEPGGTRLDIELRVSTTRAWMNAAGPVLGPLFRYGHRAVMRRGERGLRRVLAGTDAYADPPAGDGSPATDG
ncbi:SRPBCC family protein [Jiangella rhizosphaerae]|uniref:hypothetical protein n=1 Tax=Jiangella rhizosphaerae TaxID=2293569 RepID=UPI0011C464C2|nr:hypothetical protein [Jiangella rhizosphaerae]